MRFTALLLVALVGALACAQDTTTDYTQDATAKDSLNSELEITAPAKSASLQETAMAAQKTSGAAQTSARVALRRQGLSPLKLRLEESLLLAEQVFDGAEKRMNERIQDGKQLVEGGADFVQRLWKMFLDPKKL